MAEYSLSEKSPKFIRYGLDFMEKILPLIIRGQGVLIFKHLKPDDPCILKFHNKDLSLILTVEFTPKSVNVFSGDSIFIDKNNTKGLIDDTAAYYWFSIDSVNQQLYAGIGETRLDTVIYQFEFVKTEGSLWKKSGTTRDFLSSLTQVDISEGIKALRLLRDPITMPIPMLIKASDTLTMNDVAEGKILPSASLTPVNKKLYEYVSGKNFVLDDKDFPDFSKAIEHSILTPGLWCNTRLKEKSTEFSKDKPNLLETYLRITMGQNSGESPGSPYVLEIWPIGHYSPVHSHAGANAIIRVLYGNIHVRLFPYLSPKVQSFGSATFKKDDITWVNTTLNQTHQLINPKSNNKTCITIQCYMYDEADNGHYDYFDYIDADGVKQQYEPDSDMDFIKFKALMKEEWMITSSMMSCCCL
jgi:hypothetical protein